MRLAVFGATGGTGRAMIQAALGHGHEVTAFARAAGKVPPAPGLRVIQGDATRRVDVAAAIDGQDAVVVSLGNSQNPFARMVGVRRTTPRDVCEVGTRHILEALAEGQAAGQAVRLIIIGAFGTGATLPQLSFMFKMFYRLVLRKQMADKERQVAVLEASTAPYTLIQPLALTDKAAAGRWTATRDGSYGAVEVSRLDLAQFVMQHLESGADTGADTGEVITFSG